MHLLRPAYLAVGLAVADLGQASAAEFYVGGPEIKERFGDRRQLSRRYRNGTNAGGPRDGPRCRALELNVHSAKDEVHGFSEDAWMPYLTITYSIEKLNSSFKKAGQLLPMTADDGSHYANNIAMAGPGQYHVRYLIEPLSKAGFIRHVDKETGVPEWWVPFTVEWTFSYPSQARK